MNKTQRDRKKAKAVSRLFGEYPKLDRMIRACRDGDVAEYQSFAKAQEAMLKTVDDPYVDNERFAYLDDIPALELYQAKQEAGCCGFHDQRITVNGRMAIIGCNYGH